MNGRIGFALMLLFFVLLLSPHSPLSAGEKHAVTPLEADVDPGLVPEILGMGAVTTSRIPTPSQYSAGLFVPAGKVAIPQFVVKAGDPRTASDTNPNFKAGRELYNNTCARCHGVRGDGKGPEADGFQTPLPPANFMTSGGLVAGGYEYAYKRLDEGGRGAPFFSAMPSWRYDFTETQKWQIILYLYKNAGIAPQNLPKS